jgi:hypothetical protein
MVYILEKKAGRADRVTQAVESLLSKHKALSSSSSNSPPPPPQHTHKKKRSGEGGMAILCNGNFKLVGNVSLLITRDLDKVRD